MQGYLKIRASRGLHSGNIFFLSEALAHAGRDASFYACCLDRSGDRLLYRDSAVKINSKLHVTRRKRADPDRRSDLKLSAGDSRVNLPGAEFVSGNRAAIKRMFNNKRRVPRVYSKCLECALIILRRCTNYALDVGKNWRGKKLIHGTLFLRSSSNRVEIVDVKFSSVYRASFSNRRFSIRRTSV